MPEDAQVGGCSGQGLGAAEPGSQAGDPSRRNWWLIGQGTHEHLGKLYGQGQDEAIPTPDHAAGRFPRGREGTGTSTELVGPGHQAELAARGERQAMRACWAAFMRAECTERGR